ncbi:proteasome subunit alpha [Nitrospira sp. KM1]|uniref:proteasome subunit alpha n=1 Tax=Nitrospira sp. KM1 TaxID=1936990 RepID=UPI001563D29A|nr:proteasome subunit alpha [Nitrospira sp. KM1]
MYEEPYRWVEAVGNRRHYLDEQFKQGSPVVALTYESGILLLTVSKGTPKLYEIYDRLALGGMGHPADLEKLRFSLLEMAHVEGFNRSPSDVTGGRMVKYGIAPVIKQAFEEVFKAPFIVKILLAELGQKSGRDAFLVINYDGTFEEGSRFGVLAATSAVERQMLDYLRVQSGASSTVAETSLTLDEAFGAALRAWAVGDQAQRQAAEQADGGDEKKVEDPKSAASDHADLYAYLRETVAEKTIECAVLDRHQQGSSKFRSLSVDELGRLLPRDIRPSLT